MLELKEANPFIFLRRMVKISIILFSCFILSATLIHPPSASVAQSGHNCMEDILTGGSEATFYCEGPAGQYMCVYSYSLSYQLSCHQVACAPPAEGAPIFGNNCQYPSQQNPRVEQQMNYFSCNDVRYGGSMFSCVGPYV
jgi:hypothetical protein